MQIYFLQAMNQAQVLSSVVYKISRKIPLHRHFYIVDIAYKSKGSVFLSVTNFPIFSRISVYGMQDVDFIVLNRSYIDVLPNTTDGYKAELHFVCDNGVVFNSPYPNLTHFQESSFNSYLHENLLKPHGIAICKSRDILVCLWNRRYSDQSAGKVVKLHQKSEIVLEIESEKNIPLFVCPTYITENGNGDICISDVRAVVVTDAGGM